MAPQGTAARRPPGAAGPPSSYWRRHARRYDRVALLLNGRLPEVARRVAGDLAGRRRVLEVGAGTGLVTREIARAVDHVLATDRSAEMLQVLRGRLEAEGIANVDVEVADAMSLPAADGESDALVAANVVHLLPDPSSFLAEARRVLVADGLLAVPTFVHDQTRAARLLSRVLSLSGFPIVTRFDGNGLARLVQRSGFRVRRVETVAGPLPISYVLAAAVAREEPRAAAAPAPGGYPSFPMERLEEDLRGAVAAYLAGTASWTEEPGLDPDETARRRLLCHSHGQRIIRRLRAELQSLHTSFDRAAATAPDIVLTQPAHELWQQGSDALAAALRAGPGPEELARVTACLSALEKSLAPPGGSPR